MLLADSWKQNAFIAQKCKNNQQYVANGQCIRSSISTWNTDSSIIFISYLIILFIKARTAKRKLNLFHSEGFFYSLISYLILIGNIINFFNCQIYLVHFRDGRLIISKDNGNWLYMCLYLCILSMHHILHVHIWSLWGTEMNLTAASVVCLV